MIATNGKSSSVLVVFDIVWCGVQICRKTHTIKKKNLEVSGETLGKPFFLEEGFLA